MFWQVSRWLIASRFVLALVGVAATGYIIFGVDNSHSVGDLTKEPARNTVAPVRDLTPVPASVSVSVPVAGASTKSNPAEPPAKSDAPSSDPVPAGVGVPVESPAASSPTSAPTSAAAPGGDGSDGPSEQSVRDKINAKQSGVRASKTKEKPSKGGAETDSPAKSGDAAGIGQKTANLEASNKDFETYLDRLMMAESGGRLTAKNPRSTAFGPYQFISSTFLSVARRYFADDIKGLKDRQILALRSDLVFARKAAAAYSRELAAYLAAEGLKTTYGNLRLAYLLGPGGAIDVLKAKPERKLSSILGPRVLRANPFMFGMSAKDLITRCTREISIDKSRHLSTVGLPKVKHARTGPRIRVKCNLSRPSCRKWLALQRAKLKRGERAKKRKRSKRARKR